MSQYSCMNHSSFTVILSSSTWMSSIQCYNRSMSCDQLSTNQVPAVSMSLLNFQSWRHMGHNWLTCWEFSHLTMQWMWKQWEHSPQTERQVQNLAQRHHGKTFTVITKETKHKESIGNCSFRFKYFTSLMIIHIGIDWLYIVYCSTFLLVKNLTILWGCQQIVYWYTPACKWFTATFFSIGAV